MPLGERNKRHILREGQVREIRRRWQAGESRIDLAREFGVDWTTVYAVLSWTWQHVP
jgi:hypothetical protein